MGSFGTSTRLLGYVTLIGRLVQDRIGALLEPHHLTHAQAVVLVRLWRVPAESVSQTDLIDSLAVSRASGTQLLKDLEARGLVIRRPDRSDARRQLVSLTERGREMEEVVFDIFDEVEREVAGVVDEDGRRTLDAALAQMLTRARAAKGLGV